MFHNRILFNVQKVKKYIIFLEFHHDIEVVFEIALACQLGAEMRYARNWGENLLTLSLQNAWYTKTKMVSYVNLLKLARN